MRWILYSLVAVNIAMAVWWIALERSSDAPVPRLAEPAPLQPPAGVESIRLLDETEQVEEEVELSAEQQGDELGSCTVAGPFGDQRRAQVLAARLFSLGVPSAIQSRERPVGETYWVYLAPRDDMDAVARQKRYLQVRGVDSYIVTEGELAGAISLGVFSRYDLAEARYEEMLRRGLSAILRTRVSTETDYWVTASRGSLDLLEDVRRIGGIGPDFPLRREEIFCSEVASR